MKNLKDKDLILVNYLNNQKTTYRSIISNKNKEIKRFFLYNIFKNVKFTAYIL